MLQTWLTTLPSFKLEERYVVLENHKKGTKIAILLVSQTSSQQMKSKSTSFWSLAPTSSNRLRYYRHYHQETKKTVTVVTPPTTMMTPMKMLLVLLSEVQAVVVEEDIFKDAYEVINGALIPGCGTAMLLLVALVEWAA